MNIKINQLKQRNKISQYELPAQSTEKNATLVGVKIVQRSFVRMELL